MIKKFLELFFFKKLLLNTPQLLFFLQALFVFNWAVHLFFIPSWLCGREKDVKCLLIHFFSCLLVFGSSWSESRDGLNQAGSFHLVEETPYCAFRTTLRWIFEPPRPVKVCRSEGEMEGKCRPSTVQSRRQSEVEGCDWWKEKHLFISFIHLNSCESRVLVAQPVCSHQAGGTE